MSEILLKLPIVPCFSFFYVFVAVISDRLLNATLLLLLVEIIHRFFHFKQIETTQL